MDWHLYRSIYDLSLEHRWLGSFFHGVEQASIPFMAIAVVLLWLAARPGGNPKWKIAAVGALVSAGVAVATNKIISSIWFRDRPYLTHHIAHPWSNVHDASFPSDHASASFAIAFAVLAIDPLAGALFLVCAFVITIGRLFIGAHYPGDVAAGFLIGLLAATLVMRLARPLVARVAHLVERATDPLLAPLWRLSGR